MVRQRLGEKIIAKLFETIRTNGYEAALSNYAPQFFSKFSPEKWAQTLEGLDEKLGQFQSYKIVDHKVYHDSKREPLVHITVEATYSKSIAREFFSVSKRHEDPDFRIYMHNIHFNGLVIIGRPVL